MRQNHGGDYIVFVTDPPVRHLHPNGKQWFRRTYATLAAAQRAAERVRRLQGYDAIGMRKDECPVLEGPPP